MKVHGRSDAFDHVAVDALRRFSGDPVDVETVELLKESPKSSVYRLRTLGENGPATLVAKRTTITSGVLEQRVYSSVLPGIEAPRLRLHGTVPDEANDRMWLLLQDGGNQPFDPSAPSDQTAAGSALAALHVARVPSASFPDRSATWHRDALKVTRATIDHHISYATTTDEDAATLRQVMSILDVIETTWWLIADALAGLPPAFVHGDLRPKNTRRLPGHSLPSIAFLDWEMSGLGGAGLDIASLFPDETAPGLDAYVRIIRDHRPDVLRRDVIRAHRAGRVIRLITSIGWAAESLPTGNVRRVIDDQLSVFEPMLRLALRRLQEPVAALPLDRR